MVIQVVWALLQVMPWWAYVIAFVAIMKMRKRKRGPAMNEHGSARWADAKDLGGMVGASRGLILGHLVSYTRRWWQRLLESIGAYGLSAWLSGWFPGKQGALVRLSQTPHCAVFSPTRGGKGVSCIMPFLFAEKGSVVVVDPKGEAAKITARARQKMGPVIILDPFKVSGFRGRCFNPLDFIDRNSPNALAECKELAESLVVRTGQEKEPHWLDSASLVLSGIIATTVWYGEKAKGTRSLQTVREILSDPQKIEASLKLMVQSDAWGGLLARMGGQLMHYKDKELGSVLTTVNRFLSFLDDPALVSQMAKSDFDPAMLRQRTATIFLCIPPGYLAGGQIGLMRVWLASLLRSVVRGGLTERNPVTFVVDEAAALGKMEPIEHALDKYAGYGVKLQLYYQSVGQLAKCFPEDKGQTLLSNCSQVYFGINDYQTAEAVSNRLGDRTIVVKSGGMSDGSSRSTQEWGTSGPSNSSSRNGNDNWSLMARRLARPDELTRLDPRTAITFVNARPPIMTRLVRYYEKPERRFAMGPMPTKRAVAYAAAIAALIFLLMWSPRKEAESAVKPTVVRSVEKPKVAQVERKEEKVEKVAEVKPPRQAVLTSLPSPPKKSRRPPTIFTPDPIVGDPPPLFAASPGVRPSVKTNRPKYRPGSIPKQRKVQNGNVPRQPQRGPQQRGGRNRR